MRQTARFLCQISIRSGLPYHGDFGKHLEWYKHPSCYWLTQSYAECLGISILPSELQRCLKLGRSKMNSKQSLLFNASQTTDCAKAESFANRSLPRWALSMNHLPLDKEANATNGPNTWISAQEVKYLGLHLKSNTEEISLYLSKANKELTTCYTIDSVVESERLKAALNLDHSLISNTYPCKKHSQLIPLIRAWIRNGFESNLWLTMSNIVFIGAKLKPGSSHTVIDCNGYEKYVYNADQLIDKSPVDAYQRRQKLQLSGFSGKQYPYLLQNSLAAVQNENPGWSNYWITLFQARKRFQTCDIGEITKVSHDGTQKRFINASQLEPSILEECIETRHRYLAQAVYFSISGDNNE